MSVDKFGRGSDNKSDFRGIAGEGFKLTKDKNYDMLNKNLKNLHEPVDASDAVTKKYFDKNLHASDDALKKYFDKNSPSKNINFLNKIQTNINLTIKQYNEIETEPNYHIQAQEYYKIIFELIKIQSLMILLLKFPNAEVPKTITEIPK